MEVEKLERGKSKERREGGREGGKEGRKEKRKKRKVKKITSTPPKGIPFSAKGP